jgi:hypothetical protein
MDSFDVFCTECNMLIAAKVIANGHGKFDSKAINPIDEVDSEYYGEHFITCLCGRCGQPFLIQQSLYGVPGEFETVTNETILYPIESKSVPENLPDVLRNAYDQAAKAFKASLFEPSVLMCRKCLEGMCSILNVEGRNLNAKLDNLSKQGHIDSRLSDWAHQIRLIGNEAAHDINVPVTKLDAKDVLEFTEAILIYVFSLTKRFEAMKERRKIKEKQ